MASSRFLISSTTLGSSAASFTFSSIPSGYTDLCLKVSARGDATTVNYFRVTFNGDSSTIYSDTEIQADGTTGGIASGRDTNSTRLNFIGLESNGYTANTFSSAEMYFPNYTSTTSKPSSYFGVMENNATTAYMGVDAGLYRNSIALTSVTLTPASGNFAASSTFTLYGLKSS